jgi:glycosyltransferase involved in cell wall biosynthesis
MPALSVLLPVRNAGPFLDASLASLWRQTFRDFEVVAVNDGSDDGSADALDRAASREPRLRVVHLPPSGLPTALNEARRHARSPFLARHDADDVSHRTRFERQLETLHADPGVAVVGSRLRMFPDPDVGPGMRRWADWHNALLTHDAMYGERLIDSPLAHGTAVLRAEWLDRVGGWAERGWAEDLDLWLRLFEAGARFAKRPDVLYGWRQHPRSSTRRDPRYRRDRFIALKLDALERGILAGRSSLTVVGVGDSLARCATVFATRRRVRTVHAGRPSARSLACLEPPVVMVFGTPKARTRWRQALAKSGLREGSEFVFIA